MPFHFQCTKNQTLFTIRKNIQFHIDTVSPSRYLNCDTPSAVYHQLLHHRFVPNTDHKRRTYLITCTFVSQNFTNFNLLYKTIAVSDMVNFKSRILPGVNLSSIFSAKTIAANNMCSLFCRSSQQLLFIHPARLDCLAPHTIPLPYKVKLQLYITNPFSSCNTQSSSA